MNAYGDLDRQIQQLYACKYLPEAQVIALCEKAKQYFIQEPNIVLVRSPVIVCGDIHGQFFDLMELFAIAGKIPQNTYLFLGDYVNRGRQSVETFTLLIALKLRYKERITILRGNHESRYLTQTYGLYDQCQRKYGSNIIWKTFTDLFDYLPLAALIDNQIFCVHGGISPSAERLDQIRQVDRFHQIEHEGLITDLMWTDPEETRLGWCIIPKGSGYLFGSDITKQFNHVNNLSMIARAHQLKMLGYEVMHQGNLVSLFSAPNYCYRCANLAAFMDLNQHLQKTYIQFEPSPHTREENKAEGHRYPDYFV